MSERSIPDHVHDFALTGRSAAVTFHLRPAKPALRDGRWLAGWAIAIVDDAHHTLSIVSDWGNWAHRWPAAGMRVIDGRPETLLEFLGGRDEGHCDYLARKLADLADAQTFGPEATVKLLRRKLAELRLHDGRDGNVLEPAEVREVWDALAAIEHESDERDFYDGFSEIQNNHWCLDHYPLQELVVYSPTSAYEQLLHGILPALVRACRSASGPVPTMLPGAGEAAS